MREVIYQDFKKEIVISVCGGPSLLEIFIDVDWAGGRFIRRLYFCAVFYLNGNYFFAALLI